MSCHHNLAQKELPVEADMSFCNRRDDAIGIYAKVSPMSPKQRLELYSPELLLIIQGRWMSMKGLRIQRSVDDELCLLPE